VFWRTWFRTEDALSALPMAIATPTVGALSGTAWAVSHPSEVVRDGVVVLVRQSFLDALLPGGGSFAGDGPRRRRLNTSPNPAWSRFSTVARWR
jgi:hypothetical protein